MMALVWHLLAWFGVLPLAVLNGVLRVSTYGKLLGESSAKTLAIFPLLLVVASITAWLHLAHPLASLRQAWAVGIVWALTTVAFEFALGRLGPSHLSWSQLWAMYDVRTGSLWVLVILAMLVLPPLFHWQRLLG